MHNLYRYCTAKEYMTEQKTGTDDGMQAGGGGAVQLVTHAVDPYA